MKCEWKTMRADEFCFSVTDGTHDSPKPQPTGKKLITSKHLKGTYIDFDSANCITEQDYQKIISRSRVDQWDILYSMIGTIGNVYIEKAPNIEYGCKNVAIFKFDGDSDKAYWFYYYLQSPKAKEYIHTQLRGSTQSYVPLGALREMPVTVPSKAIQKEIIEVLKALDDKIELNNKINANLQQQAQAIFKSWFVDFEPFQDGEFVESELGPIPKGWRVGTISDLGTVVGGATPTKSKPEYYTSNGIGWITPKDLAVNKNLFLSHGATDITQEGLKNSSARIMPKGTVLFSSRAPIGYMAIANDEVTTNQGFKSVVPHENIGTAYVYYFLKYNLTMIDSLGSGSTFKEVSGATMKSVLALVPDDNTLRKFTNICDPMFEKRECLERENSALTNMRDVLLPKLMNGEIDISGI